MSRGTQRQKDAYLALQEIQIFNLLQEYAPILAGTVPIDIDLPKSDLDIICEVYYFERFKRVVTEYFGSMEGFKCSVKTVNHIDRIVLNFTYKDWPIEIFGQPINTLQQNGYKHMVIEDRMLSIIGEEGKEQIRRLKQSGLKTEPAFGQLLGIIGDPYEKLLEMVEWEETRLIEFIRGNI
ncbi:DUF4269 domain-containing protein [Paenibacillus sediminis]|uniref:DUF4269 domain-containing protein n=1 Tax=Paenibacillus sediminis TaxID=664909 RepID=A0ABS4H1X9_9BACL|nr:DUF4269 domain-containing protein [Paenibacillus sediminis]MBP1936538.1 hypothetical protein [Paenibacillus sediminis]